MRAYETKRTSRWMTARRSLPSNFELFIEAGVLNIHVRSISDLFPLAWLFHRLRPFFNHPFSPPARPCLFSRGMIFLIIKRMIPWILSFLAELVRIEVSAREIIYFLIEIFVLYAASFFWTNKVETKVSFVQAEVSSTWKSFRVKFRIRMIRESKVLSLRFLLRGICNSSRGYRDIRERVERKRHISTILLFKIGHVRL